jgi:tetratricopeptide (TPR) repeat protein
MIGVLSPEVTYPKAKEATTKALQLDENLGEAHAVLAVMRFRYDRDWIGAENEFKRALALNPSFAATHIWYSHYLLPSGREEESFAESKRALELDPFNLIINTHLGWNYLYARQYDKAIEQLRKTLELDPNFAIAHLFLGQAYEKKAMYGQAIVEFQNAVNSASGAVHLAALGHGYAMSGDKVAAQRILDELKSLSRRRYVPSYELAVVCIGLGDKEQALVWLQRAYDQRDSGWLVDASVDPRFEPLHSDPRFQDLLRRMGSPP